MWEYRLVWPDTSPDWWNKAWKSGTDILRRRRRSPEDRPDVYLLLRDRVDVGLKLRGGAQGDFDAKVLHARAGGWELWEKVAFFRWDDLEATRLATLIRQGHSHDIAQEGLAPTRGAQAELQRLGLESLEVKVEKKRIQAAAGELFGTIPGHVCRSSWLAELVEIRLPRRTEPLFSVCVETMDCVQGGFELFPRDRALCCGYPELLIRYERNGL